MQTDQPGWKWILFAKAIDLLDIDEDYITNRAIAIGTSTHGTFTYDNIRSFTPKRIDDIWSQIVLLKQKTDPSESNQ